MQGGISGKALKCLVDIFIEQGPQLDEFQRYHELQGLDEDEFYPVSLYVDLAAYAETRLDNRESIIHLGRRLGRDLMDQYLSSQDITSVQGAITELNQVHGEFSKNVYGSWNIVDKIEEGSTRSLTIEYSLPYNCALNEGILLEFAKEFGGQFPQAHHTQCMRDGEPHCVYILSWRP